MFFPDINSKRKNYLTQVTIQKKKIYIIFILQIRNQKMKEHFYTR